MKLTAKTKLQIQKPVDDVFEAIVSPDEMTRYFISESSGRLEQGKEVTWKFPEFEDKFPVTQIKIEPDRSVSFVWDPETIVVITLEPVGAHSTIVTVKEDGKELNPENLDWVIRNTGGWANFLACMKAWMEYGIELRKGAFDFMRKN